jgi:hypothetical protein
MMCITTTAPRATPDDSLTRLLDAIPASYRPLTRLALTNPRVGGSGLRAWLNLIYSGDRPLPPDLPGELIEVYLTDDEAEPHHDCERCGLPVPVRVERRCGHEASVEREYFPACPNCGGRTGRFAYWSRCEAGSN